MERMLANWWLLASLLTFTTSFVITIGHGLDAAEKLFDCRFKLSKLPTSFLQLSVHHLLVETNSSDTEQQQQKSPRLKVPTPKLAQINRGNSLDELQYSRLDPYLPFVFFINGFNNYGAVNSTWMHNTAGVLASYHQAATYDDGDELRNEPGDKRRYERANFVILSWQIAGVFTSDILSMPLAYYRTMANYDMVVEAIERSLYRLIDFVEYKRHYSWPSESDRLDYYSKFRFYGHSLGSHILSHALQRVHQARPEIRFGRLVGLDPALPCFVDQNHGIGRASSNNSTHQVVVIHSNAAILGSYSKRGDLEVVLNGGTFQPNCSYADLECHHVRATDVLGYVDDECQMVAYQCSKYEQFKLGACETCESNLEEQQQNQGCLLVNLPEQHVDGEHVEGINETRRLADSNEDRNLTTRLVKRSSARLKSLPNSYYFVNTNPNLKPGKMPPSHCVQHYQMRLLVMNDNEEGQRKCPLSSFSYYSSHEMKIQLFHETDRSRSSITRPAVRVYKTLSTILEDKLYTGLINYPGKPALYVGAIIDGINFAAWSKCLLSKVVLNDLIGDYKFVLDIAFMSNINPDIRHAYSSILCSNWHPLDPQLELMLGLCRQAELANVSNQVDGYLRQHLFNHQTDSWQISLLDNLFSLYSEWEPF